MNKKLSIIVPVYNSLQYLTTCLDSIKRQKYDPLEVILVDDGSTDGSGKLCDDYVCEDSRFKVIHKKNSGLSEARNTGIDFATGDYIAFVDSDDLLIEQPYLHLINILDKTNADIACMDKLYSEKPIYSIPNKVDCLKIALYDNHEIFEGLCNQTISEAAWDKVYKRSLFERQRFQKDTLNEDFLFLINLCKNRIKMVHVNYIGYCYMKREGSITNSGFKKNMIDAVYNANYAYENASTESSRKAAESYLLHRILMFLVNMPIEYVNEKNIHYLYVISRLKQLRCCITKSNRSMRDKILLESFLYCPRLARKVCGWYILERKNKANFG